MNNKSNKIHRHTDEKIHQVKDGIEIVIMCINDGLWPDMPDSVVCMIADENDTLPDVLPANLKILLAPKAKSIPALPDGLQVLHAHSAIHFDSDLPESLNVLVANAVESLPHLPDSMEVLHADSCKSLPNHPSHLRLVYPENLMEAKETPGDEESETSPSFN